MSPDISQTIDARGLICPLPVLRTGKVLRGLPVGSVVRVLADDRMAIIDIPHFCTQAGHRLVSQDDAGDHQTYVIEKTK